MGFVILFIYLFKILQFICGYKSSISASLAAVFSAFSFSFLFANFGGGAFCAGAAFVGAF